MRPDFETRLNSFFEGCKRIHAEYCTKNGYENERRWSTHWLKRWVRVENPGAYCFVDIETGEVLKPNGFDRPAITKTKRGNIFDDHNGLEHMGPWGPLYARELRKEHS